MVSGGWNVCLSTIVELFYATAVSGDIAKLQFSTLPPNALVKSFEILSGTFVSAV